MQEKNLLIVDDEDAVLFAFIAFFSDPGISVYGAGSLTQARELMSQQRFDAGIIDVRLTGSEDFDGYTVLKEMKTQNPDSKIIVMTAYGRESIKDEVMHLGADRYFEKPVSPKRIGEDLHELGIL